MTIKYQKLEAESKALQQAAIRMQEASKTKNGAETFVAYCEIIVCHERIRDIVAGRL